MRESGPASVSLIVCETVLDEKSGITSAIRIMDVLYIGRRAALARFFVIAYLHSRAGDLGNHTGTVQMSGRREGRWTIVAMSRLTHSIIHIDWTPVAPVHSC
jgi:hypothetical protein